MHEQETVQNNQEPEQNDADQKEYTVLTEAELMKITGENAAPEEEQKQPEEVEVGIQEVVSNPQIMFVPDIVYKVVYKETEQINCRIEQLTKEVETLIRRRNELEKWLSGVQARDEQDV